MRGKMAAYMSRKAPVRSGMQTLSSTSLASARSDTKLRCAIHEEANKNHRPPAEGAEGLGPSSCRALWGKTDCPGDCRCAARVYTAEGQRGEGGRKRTGSVGARWAIEGRGAGGAERGGRARWAP